MQVISLETERLVLRQWREHDKAAFADLNSDPQVREFFLERLSQNQSDAMFTQYAEFIAERGWGMWAVEEKVSTNFVGVVGLNIPKAEMPFAPCVEIAWRLAVRYWGRGYAT
jgi:RimJ/RimL family protein N-acetyltransferase